MEDRNTELSISNEDILQMTTDIVASFVSNNTIPSDSISDIIKNVHRTVQTIAATPAERPVEKPKPAVAISKSVHDDYIVCLEDGKKLKMLKRYLRSNYNMTPDEYRRKWGLAADYPMVAPSYAKKRSEFAKKIGLGRQNGVRRKG